MQASPPRVFDWTLNQIHPPPGQSFLTFPESGFASALAGRASTATGAPDLRLYRVGPYGGLIGRPAKPLVEPGRGRSRRHARPFRVGQRPTQEPPRSRGRSSRERSPRRTTMPARDHRQRSGRGDGEDVPRKGGREANDLLVVATAPDVPAGPQYDRRRPDHRNPGGPPTRTGPPPLLALVGLDRYHLVADPDLPAR